MTVPGRGECGGRFGAPWLSGFLSFFLLFMMADTFLEAGPYRTVVMYGTLITALVIFFSGALGRSGSEGEHAAPRAE